MKIVSHIENESAPAFIDAEDKWMDNRTEPVVRGGGEPFECHFAPESTIETFIVDPRRSLALPLFRAIERSVAPDWSIADFIVRLVRDLGFEISTADAAATAAFYAVFPPIAARLIDDSYMHISAFNNQRRHIVRVVNNPFFHALPSAGDARLLEIAQFEGCAYAVDTASEIPPSAVLAREIALLHHVQNGIEAVEKARVRLFDDIDAVVG